MLDCTGSMAGFINEAKTKIRSFVTSIGQIYPDIQLRIAFVGYRDHCDHQNRHAILQFTPSIRNKYISFHRKTGKLYILSSLLCITSLYVMLPRTGCTACMPSQFTVTSLWLLFIILAYYFIKQRKIKLHQRMMISSFICAAYFVTIRVIDAFAMGVFNSVFPNESTAFLASDIFVWLLPLLLFWMYWLIRDRKEKRYRMEIV